MNRHDRRVSDARVRQTGTVSPRLLQETLAKQSAEFTQVRNVMLALIKQEGRIRVSKQVLDSLNDGDACESRDIGDAILFEYKPSSMVVPEGVSNGKPGPGPKGAA
jgi:hypothetical protein